jgi:hypothetical protein
MKKSLFIFVLFLLPLLLIAQNEYQEWKTLSSNYQNIDISKYYTPDIVRNTLSVNLNVTAENNTSQYRNVYNSLLSTNSTSSNNTFLGNVNADFSRYTNTRKKISTISANLLLRENFQYSSIKNYGDNLESEDIVHNTKIISENSLSIYWANKHYIYKPLFIIYNIGGSAGYNFLQDVEKSHSTALNVNVQLGVGYGRIENVEDARQAVYIVNALSKRGVLTRDLSDEEMFDLSRQISTVKNKRFLDSRLRLIDEISAVDTFFVQKDLLRDNSVAYFTTLYDMWQYGALFERKSGYELSFTVRPYYLGTFETAERENTVYSHSQDFYSRLSFSYNKPVKLNWQHTVELGGELRKSQLVYPNKHFSLYGQYLLNYYLNTRTSVETAFGQQFRTYETLNQYDAYISATVNYYLSPQFRLKGSYSFGYEHYFINGTENNFSKQNRYRSLFNVQLIYAFF